MKYVITAALAMTAAAAQAQSQVHIYGVADAGLVAEYGTPAGSSPAIGSGLASGSRLGFKGTEDLGNGLSAVFVLEGGYNIDTGATGQGGLRFGRQAFVGLRGAFGSITVGRQYSPYYRAIRDVADPFEDGLAGQATNVMAGNHRMDNAVLYTTPERAGWSAEVAYGAGEVPELDVGKHRKRVFSGVLSYAPGPLVVMLGHHRREDALAPDHARNTILAARYTLGAVSAHAAFVRSRDLAGARSRDALLGLTWKHGPHRVLLSAVQRDDRSAARRDARQYGAGYLYGLAPRTDLYAAYGHIDNDNGAVFTVGNATDSGSGNAALNLGIRHCF
ncbi:porin [Pseudoduganella plicata]|uniref:Porin n=1 Tax=Pseudoduganella plicata TaxID=321984 RepID=A0A4P7BB46_9BURK|nr:porin [Pseudoduganella plicata]QBQ35350.1 porin [Pseudoduganella plicata]GGZ01031.1 porin [Pseudoduganella plicata]